MKKLILTSAFALACFILQAQTPCTIKMGGSYFTNMKHMILYRGLDVFTINYADNKFDVTMLFYDASGKELGRVLNGKLVDNGFKILEVKNTAEQFSVIQKSNQHVLCTIKKTNNEQRKRCELWLWLDTWLSSGFYLQCTPDESHSPQMQNMLFKGAEFSNGGTAKDLN